MVESKTLLRGFSFNPFLPGNAVIAERAVRGPRWSEESTGVTVLELDGHSVDGDDFMARLVQPSRLFFFFLDDLFDS